MQSSEFAKILPRRCETIHFPQNKHLEYFIKSLKLSDFFGDYSFPGNK